MINRSMTSIVDGLNGIANGPREDGLDITVGSESWPILVCRY